MHMHRGSSLTAEWCSFSGSSMGAGVWVEGGGSARLVWCHVRHCYIGWYTVGEGSSLAAVSSTACGRWEGRLACTAALGGAWWARGAVWLQSAAPRASGGRAGLAALLHWVVHCGRGEQPGSSQQHRVRQVGGQAWLHCCIGWYVVGEGSSLAAVSSTACGRWEGRLACTAELGGVWWVRGAAWLQSAAPRAAGGRAGLPALLHWVVHCGRGEQPGSSQQEGGRPAHSTVCVAPQAVCGCTSPTLTAPTPHFNTPRL